MPSMIYCTVGSNKLEEAKRFYDALLPLAGLTPMFEHPSGGRVYGPNGTVSFAVLGPYNGQPATVGNGSMTGFSLATRKEVDALYAQALKLGGVDEGAPGERGPNAYFSYFRDLDGNKLCAFCLASVEIG